VREPAAPVSPPAARASRAAALAARGRRWLPALVLLPLALLLRPVLWTPLDHRFFDYFHSLRPVPPWTEVVVVGIDAATRAELPRPVHPLAGHVTEHAALTRRLAGAGARAIAFDIDFDPQSLAAPPAALAAAFAEAGNVHIVMTLREERAAGAGGGMLLAGRAPDASLMAASRGAFVVNVRIDPDGTLRRFRPDPRLAGLGLETLPERLAGVRAGRGVPVEFPSVERPMPVVSYREVLAGDPAALAAVAGRIVLVGLVEDSGTDVVTVPRLQRLAGGVETRALPGVMVLAAVTETLVRGAPIRDVGGAATVAWLLAWCLAALAIPPRARPVMAGLAVIGLLLAALAATGLLHAAAGRVLPAGTLLGAIVLCGAWVLVAAHVETARKLQAEQLERDRVRSEMAAARRMQEMFLPGTIPAVPGYDLWGENISSLAVSGDYFDLLDLGADGPLLLLIADVSGKGLPASLLMSNVQAGLHSQAIARPFDLARTVANLNRLVCENTDEVTFVTLFLAELHKASGRLRYVRAGHDYPLLLRADGTLDRLEAGGLFIGMMPGMDYDVHEARLAPGDALCLYTDGVTEARSPGDEEFGLARLGETLRAHAGRGAAAAGEAIIDDVRAFSGLDRQADDVTVVVLRRDAADSDTPREASCQTTAATTASRPSWPTGRTACSRASRPTT